MKGPSAKRERIRDMGHASARVVIASYFVARSIGLITDPTSMRYFLTIAEVPDYLLWPNIGFELIAALAIMVGFQTRTAAALLALYVFWSSFILNYTPGDPVAIGAFWRDLALIGGLLLLSSQGRSRFALDNLLDRQPDAAKAPKSEQIISRTAAQSHSEPQT